MKLLVDLFACQTKSRFRGIGRYTLSLIHEMISIRGNNELIALASLLYQETFENLRQDFIRLLPIGAFLPYYHEPIRYDSTQKIGSYIQIAETLVRQAYQAVSPDVVLTPSPFEGWDPKGEQGVVPPPNSHYCTYGQVAVLYDLIPYIFHEQYIDVEPEYKKWYFNKFENLTKYDLLLAISESTRQDAINNLGIKPDRVVNISGAISSQFKRLALTEDEKEAFLRRFGILCPFVFNIGAADFRKNIDGTLRAYSQLPGHIKNNHQLVLTYGGGEDTAGFQNKLNSFGLTKGDVIVVENIKDEDLVLFYNLCKLFFFPSLYEGFGLPVLEAMACGAPVIASNNSSIPEIAGRSDMLFDASNDQSVANLLFRALTDDAFCREISAYGEQRVKEFSWENSAKRAWEAIETIYSKKRQIDSVNVNLKQPKLRIAYVLAELEPDPETKMLLISLSKYFVIDLFILKGGKFSRDFLGRSSNIYPWSDLLKRRKHYNTVVYKYDSTSASTQMLDLMKAFPGVVVMEDIHISDGIEENHCSYAEYFTDPENGLWESHGLKAVINYISTRVDMPPLKWLANWQVVKYAQELILYSDDQAKELILYYGKGWLPRPTIISHIDNTSPEISASQIAADYAEVIRKAARTDERILFAPLIKAASDMDLSQETMVELARNAASNFSLRNRPRLLIDVSNIAEYDLRSGIQRVVKNLIREFVHNDNRDLKIETVRFKEGKFFRANRFSEILINLPMNSLGEESVILIQPGDTLFLLDLEICWLDKYQSIFKEIRRVGGKIVTMIYDLIPLRFPDLCHESVVNVFSRWFEIIISHSDQLICISRSVADEVISYINEHSINVLHKLDISYIHLGADLEIVSKESTIREQLQHLKDTIRSPLFLMVGTIEPRKGIAFTLDALELLWNQGKNYVLCIAGRVGWNVEDIETRIQNHPELGKRLFFFANPSDAEINLCYSMSTALIAASVAEGFGLPIWEAAMHQVPSIASDIPVFREIGGEGTIYFPLGSPTTLANAVEDMNDRSIEDRLALVKKIEILSWKQSAEWALDIINGAEPYQVLAKMEPPVFSIGDSVESIRVRGLPMIFIDITSSLKYRTLLPNGIARTELECVKYVVQNNLEGISFCAYSEEKRHLVTLDKEQVVDLLSGIRTIESDARKIDAPKGVVVENVDLVESRSRLHLKNILRGFAISVYRKLPIEIGIHIKQLLFETIEVFRSGKQYLRKKRPALQEINPINPPVLSTPETVNHHCPLTSFIQGDILVCLGFVWDYLDLEKLYTEKLSKGFKLISVVHDLIPIMMPEFQNGNSDSQSKAILNQIWASEALFCNSDNTLNDLSQFISKVGAPERTLRRIHLGSFKNQAILPEHSETLRGLEPGKFILHVSTMEPRKNHELLFHVWQSLYAEHAEDLLPLVIVGNSGWHTEDLRNQIRLNPWLYPKYINWHFNVSDAELEWLYKNCRFTVFPSLYEGWGLPISEAIERGKFCISSNLSSMPEAGQGLTEMLHPLDFQSWKDRIYYYMTNDEALASKEKFIFEHTREVTWNQTYQQFFSDIADICMEA